MVTQNKQMVTPTAAVLLATSHFRLRSGFCLIKVRRCVVGCSSRLIGERKEKCTFHRIPAMIKHRGEQILPASARTKDMSDVDRASFGSCPR